MRCKRFLLFFMSVMLVVSILFSGMPLAAEAPQPLSVNEATRQTMITEYGKDIMAKSAAALNPQPPVQQNYDRERDQIANQLTLFTENEDIKYIIVEGDTLTISYKDRDQISRAAYKVSETGEIFVPVCGSIKVAGLNRRQARERVEMMLKEYIRDPRVLISINTDGKVMIFGAVLSPGVLEIRPKWTVLEAILSSGGFNRQTAELASVIVMRGPMEKRSMLKLNLKKLVTKGDASDNIFIKPGDFVYVPMTLISNLDAFWGTMSKYLMWWYGLGGGQPVVNGNDWNYGGLPK